MSVKNSKFYEQQFQLQLELEDLTADQLQAHGDEQRDRANKADVSRPGRIELAVRVLLALKRIPRLKLDPFEAEDRFVIWCRGFGIPETEVFDEMARMIQQRRDRSTP